MKQVIVTRSNSGNCYTYFRDKKELSLSHPLLAHIFELYQDGTDPEEWLNNLQGHSITIPGLGVFKKQTIEHYFEKFRLLQANGYFSRDKKENEVTGKFTPTVIEKSLANIGQVTFEVTERCQLNCKYCGYGDFYRDYDQRENKNLSVDKAHRLLDFLGEYWNSEQNLSHDRNIYIGFYGGEPLLNIDFIKNIIAYVKAMPMAHNRFTFTMTTNGLLVEKYMDFLAENRFNLLISLDGDREGNDYRVFQNGNPAFDDIIKNISALQNKHPEYFQKQVNFHAVHHKRNTVESIFRFIKETFNKIPIVNEISAYGINPQYKDQFMATYSNLTESLFQSTDYKTIERELFTNLPTIRSMSIFLHHYGGSTYKVYPALAFPHKKSVRTPTGTCLPFSRRLYVTVNGKILPCETIGHRFALGNVTATGVDIDFQRMADFYNRQFDAVRSMCRQCYNLDTCLACLFNMEFEDGHPKCTQFQGYADFSLYIADHMSYLEKNPGLSKRILEEVVSE